MRLQAQVHLDGIEGGLDRGRNPGKGHGHFLTGVATRSHHLAGFDIARANLQAQRCAVAFPVEELGPGAESRAGVDGDPEARLGEGLLEVGSGGFNGAGAGVIAAGYRHDCDLDRCDGWREDGTAVIAVDHQDPADGAGTHSPGGREDGV